MLFKVTLISYIISYISPAIAVGMPRILPWALTTGYDKDNKVTWNESLPLDGIFRTLPGKLLCNRLKMPLTFDLCIDKKNGRVTDVFDIVTVPNMGNVFGYRCSFIHENVIFPDAKYSNQIIYAIQGRFVDHHQDMASAGRILLWACLAGANTFDFAEREMQGLVDKGIVKLGSGKMTSNPLKADSDWAKAVESQGGVPGGAGVGRIYQSL